MKLLINQYHLVNYLKYLKIINFINLTYPKVIISTDYHTNLMILNILIDLINPYKEVNHLFAYILI